MHHVQLKHVHDWTHILDDLTHSRLLLLSVHCRRHTSQLRTLVAKTVELRAFHSGEAQIQIRVPRTMLDAAHGPTNILLIVTLREANHNVICNFIGILVEASFIAHMRTYIDDANRIVTADQSSRWHVITDRFITSEIECAL